MTWHDGVATECEAPAGTDAATRFLILPRFPGCPGSACMRAGSTSDGTPRFVEDTSIDLEAPRLSSLCTPSSLIQ